MSPAIWFLAPGSCTMRNIKLILEYDGTNYHGWQSQRGSGIPTVQNALEEALRQLTQEEIRTVSSGRTDAGVHARGHVANFLTASAIPGENFSKALNRLLPADIRVTGSADVHADFHSRYSATGKTYCYCILNRQAPSALLRDRAWHVDRKLNVAAMRRAAAVLAGTHDFSAFRSAGCGAANPVRRLRDITVKRRGDRIDITLTADAFLMHMARNIVGTLVDVGLGRFTPADVRRILRSRDRTQAGRTAPACGLCLEEVFYASRRSRKRPSPQGRLKS